MRAPIRVSTRTLIRLARLGQALCLLMSLSGFVIMVASASPAQAQGRCQSVCIGENANPDSCSWCERIEHSVGAGTMAAGSMLTLGGLLGATLLGQLCQGLQQGAGAAGNGGLRREDGSAVATATEDTPEGGGSAPAATDQTTGEGEDERETPEGRYYGGFGRRPTGAEGGQPTGEGDGQAGGGAARPAEVEGTGPRPAVSAGEDAAPTEGEPPRLTAEGEPEARPATAESETYRPAAPEGGAPPAGPATDAARDRWQMLQADAEGRVYDANRNHILNVDGDGNVTDLNGRPVSEVSLEDTPGAHIVRGYVDADGNEIRASYGGNLQRFEPAADGRGGTYHPTDLPDPKGPPVPLSDEVATRWQAVGAGPNGEMRAPDGNIIGRIDTDGNMWTADGRPVSGASLHDAGRLQWFNTPDGQHWAWDDATGQFRSLQMPDGEPFRPLSQAEWQRIDAQRAAQQAPTMAESDQPLRPGDVAPGTEIEGQPGQRHFSPEVEDSLRAGTYVPPGQPPTGQEGAEGPGGVEGEGARAEADSGTKISSAEQAADRGEGGDTRVEGEGPGARPGPGGETRVEGGEARASDAEGGEARASGAEGGEARASSAEGGEARASSAEGGEVRATGAEGGEVRPSGAEGGEVRSTGAEGGEVRPSGAEGGEVRATGAEGGEVRPSGAEGETRPAGADAEGGSLASSAFSRTMDVKSVQDLYNQHIADGKTPAEALSLAVAQTGAGNVVVDMGIIDPKMSAAAGALLPGGMRNILPEQAIQNWMGTGHDALNAFGESIGSSLASGELDTSAFDRFAEGVANRPGVDPFKGIGQAVELATEEIYRNDGGSLVSDLQQIYETGAGADVANEAMTDFQQAVERGQYGSPLQGINHLMSGASEVIADPTTTIGQFVDDVKNIYNHGVGDGFWDEAVQETANVIKNTPIASTIYDGYHQVFSGVAQQGVTGFASEMAEGASALAGEAYDAAANSLADAANSTANYIKSWF